MDELSKWCLQQVGFPGRTFNMPLDKQSVTIGRYPADIVCHGRNVSRLHCRLDFFHENWHITDLHSLKGVFINRNLITVNQSRLLKDGDVIGIGVPKMSYSGTDTYIFRFCRASSAKDQISKFCSSSLKECRVVLQDIGSLLSNKFSIPVDLFFQLESRLSENSGNDSGNNRDPIYGQSCQEEDVMSDKESEETAKTLTIRMPEESDIEDELDNIESVGLDSKQDCEYPLTLLDFCHEVCVLSDKESEETAKALTIRMPEEPDIQDELEEIAVGLDSKQDCEQTLPEFCQEICFLIAKESEVTAIRMPEEPDIQDELEEIESAD